MDLFSSLHWFVYPGTTNLSTNTSFLKIGKKIIKLEIIKFDQDTGRYIK